MVQDTGGGLFWNKNKQWNKKVGDIIGHGHLLAIINQFYLS